MATYDLHEYEDEKRGGALWSYGRSGSRPSSEPEPAAPARSSRCGSGGDDRGQPCSRRVAPEAERLTAGFL